MDKNTLIPWIISILFVFIGGLAMGLSSCPDCPRCPDCIPRIPACPQAPACPACPNLVYNYVMDNEVSDLELLDQLVTRFDLNNPWVNNSYMCWPRAVDFTKEAGLLGFNVSIEYGCKAGYNDCHAWPVVSLPIWGSRGDFPVLPSNTVLKQWQKTEEGMFKQWHNTN